MNATNRLLTTALGVLLWPVSVLAAPWVPAEGASFDATIIKSTRCGPSRPDDRLCWKFAVQATSGQVLADLRLYQWAKIVSASGKPTYAHPALMPNGRITREIPPNSPEGKKLALTFYSAAGAITKGARVRVKIYTCQAADLPAGQSQCEAESVQTK